jgi:hypothetical protein
MIRDVQPGSPDPDPHLLPITELGSRVLGSKRHRILDPDPQHCSLGVPLTRQLDPNSIGIYYVPLVY